jgi:hypothetical protein
MGDTLTGGSENLRIMADISDELIQWIAVRTPGQQGEYALQVRIEAGVEGFGVTRTQKNIRVY